MKFYVDEREHELFAYLVEKNTTPTALFKKVLPIGDILLTTNDDVEVLLIERKTILDLLASINDGRYKEQSHRLLHSSELPHHRVIYLIEGLFQGGQTLMQKQTVYSAMVSLNQIKGFSTLRTWCLAETGDILLNMADKLQREMDKGNYSVNKQVGLDEKYCNVVKKVKKDNITPDNMGEIILCQIPGISSVNAIALMKDFTSISHFIERIKADPSFLDTFICETNGKKRKLGKNIIQNIRDLLLK
jgi:ERCC4-type nuclease